MADEINLILSQKTKKKEAGLFFSLSLLSMLISMIVGVLVLLFVLYLKNSISQTTFAQTKELATISQMDEKRIKMLIIHERLASIQKILAINHGFNKRLSLVEDNIPAGVQITGVDAKDTTIKVNLSSPSLLPLNDLLENALPKLAGKKNTTIQQTVLDQFGIGTGSLGYTAGITFVFAGEN